MRNCILVTVSLFVFVYSQAQTATVTLSEKFKLKDPVSIKKVGASYYSMVVDYKNMQFAYSAKLDKVKLGVEIVKYDGNMQEAKRVILHGPDKTFGPFPPRMYIFGQNILVFYYQVKEDNKIQLSFSVIDPETLAETKTKDLYIVQQANPGFRKGMQAILHNTLALKESDDKKYLQLSQSGNTSEIFVCDIDDHTEVRNSAFTREAQTLQEGHKYLLPLGRYGVNMVRYYTEVEQFATIDFN